MPDPVYTTKKITETLTLINEGDSPFMAYVMALVEGSDRALLIDTANGAGDLAAFVKTLTAKPVTCILSHGHPDHVGGAAQFPDLLMSALDDPLLATPLGHGDIKDGDLFETGGLSLRTIAVPGHTPGSMAFYSEAENWCVVSDAINPFLWLWLDVSLSVEACRASLVRFKTLVPPGTRLFCGHSMDALQPDIVDTLIAICDELLAGKTAADQPFQAPFPGLDTTGAKTHTLNGATIVYNEGRIK